MGFDFGMSKSKTTSASGSYQNRDAQSTNTTNQNVWGMQQPFFGDLFAAGQNAMQGFDPNSFIGQNMQGVSNLQGGMTALNNMANTGGAIAGFANPNNQLVQDQIGNLGQSLGDFFQNQLNPAIMGNSVAAGGLGGGRQQVAQGQAAGEMGQAFQQGVTDIQANAYGQAQNAAMMQDQNRLQSVNQMSGVAGMMNNLGMSSMQAPWLGMQNMAGLLGNPLALTDSYSQSTDTSRANQWSLSQAKDSKLNFGMDGT